MNCGDHKKPILNHSVDGLFLTMYGAAATRDIFALGHDDQMTRNESTSARMRRDHNDECQVMQCLQRFKVFSTNSHIDTLHNIATMDLATDDIQESLVNAGRLDQKQLRRFALAFIHSHSGATGVFAMLLWKFVAEATSCLQKTLQTT